MPFVERLEERAEGSQLCSAAEQGRVGGRIQKLKVCAKEENKKNHNLWQIKCKNIIKVAKRKDFEEKTTEIIQTNDVWVLFFFF